MPIVVTLPEDARELVSSLSELISFTLFVNGPFAAPYLGSAWLFRRAARRSVSP